MLLPLVLAIAPLPTLDPPPEARQFDFWVGEWSVQNRHLRDGSKWADGSVARARVTPVLDGTAILEEWSGPLFSGKRMSGYSLRAFDPIAKEWAILLNWSQDGGSAFSRKRGTFRHGRGEFISRWKTQDGSPMAERYTFSDALPTSCRWDQARSTDGGATWRTDWIMEFSRTAPAEAAQLDRTLSAPWQEGSASPHAEARWADFAPGLWLVDAGPDDEGVHGTSGAIRVRCAHVCEKRLLVLQLDRLEKQRWVASEFWSLSYVPGTERWEAWLVQASDPRFQHWIDAGSAPGQIALRAEGGKRRNLRLEKSADGLSLTTFGWGPSEVPLTTFFRESKEGR